MEIGSAAIRITEIERRSGRRRRTLKTGRIAINDAFSTYDVTIRDMSPGGAKLRLETPCVLPAAFHLVILNPNTGVPSERPVKLMWQRGTEVGVQFERPALAVV